MSQAAHDAPHLLNVEPPAGQRVALVVGVNGQPIPGRDALKYAVNDARDMADVLQNSCGFELFRSPLLGEEATTDNVRQTVLDLADELNDQDFVLFYFSGHGEPMTVQANLDDVYFVTHDFKASHVRRDQHAHLSMRWLREVLYEHEKTVDVLLILECCYAGDVGRVAPDPYRNELLQRLAYYFDSPSETSEASKRGLRIALTATTPGAPAYEREGHGMMTQIMLPALQGMCASAFDPNKRDCITLTSLYGYLEGQMKEQQPRFFGAGGPLVLAIHPGRVDQLQREQLRTERIQKLQAMFADHSAFLLDRLASFQGRAGELAVIRRQITERQRTGGYVTITGRAGQGKSSIIARLVEEYATEQERGMDGVAFHFIPLNPGGNYQFRLLRDLMARLIMKYDLPDFYVDEQSTAGLRDYFPKVLKEVVKQGGKEAIFIDGLDQLEEEGFGDGPPGKRDLSFLPNDVPPGIVFVLGTRPNDTLRPLQLLKPRDEHELSNLSRDDFSLILQHHGVTLEAHIADRFYQVLDEHALFLDLAAKELAKRGSISRTEVEEIIKQITENPENLFGLAIERLSERGTFWEQVMKSLLGVLLVAREPLARIHLKQIINMNQVMPVNGGQISEGLERLGGLVIRDGQQRYTLSHLKLREYLREDVSRPHKRIVFDVEDEQRLHRWFVSWCERDGFSGIWDDALSDPEEQGRRIYARQHYIAHLYHALAWTRLFDVLDEGSYGKEKVQEDLSMRTYALDLDWGRQAAASPRWGLQDGIRHLAHLWRYTLLRCSLASRADRYPEAAFQLMALLGDEAKALGLAELITRPEQRAAMLLVLARFIARLANREADGMRMFLRVQEIIDSIPDVWQQASALRELATALGQAGRREEAQRVWAEAERVSASISDERQKASAVRELAVALAHQGFWAEAERISITITYEDERVEALMALAATLAQEGFWAEAERICVSISDRDERAKALTALATALVQAGRREEAQRLWAEAERISTSIFDESQRTVAVRELVTALAQQQQWAEAERVSASISDPDERAEALMALAIALAQQQQWAEAERVSASISDPDERAEALMALATALVQASQREEAQRLWGEAERVSASISDPDKRAEALMAQVIALAQQGFWTEAERVSTSISAERQKVKAVIALATALAQAGQREEAQRLWGEAERVSASISDRDERAEALMAQVIALAQQGFWTEAERVSASISAESQRTSAVRELVTALAQQQLWEEAERVSASITSERQKANAMRELAITLAQQQLWEEAERVSASISAERQKANAMRELAIALAQQQLWGEAERVSASISDPDEQAEALMALVIALAQQQQWTEAERVSASITSERQKANAMRELVIALAQQGFWTEAERVSASISAESQRTSAMTALVTALAQQQLWAEAERVSVSIVYEDERARALMALATALVQAGQREETQRLWGEAERVSASIVYEDERAEALMALAIALAQQQQWTEAERVSASIVYEDERAKALMALVIALIQQQQWTEAERVSASITYKWQRANAVTALVTALAQQRLWTEAERVCTFISDEDEQAKALMAVAATLAIHRDYEQLLRLVHRWWQRVERRSKAVSLLPLAYALIPLDPELALAFSDAFFWVDAFLRGEQLQ